MRILQVDIETILGQTAGRRASIVHVRIVTVGPLSIADRQPDMTWHGMEPSDRTRSVGEALALAFWLSDTLTLPSGRFPPLLTAALGELGAVLVIVPPPPGGR